MKEQISLNELKRNLLLNELRDALNAGPDYHDGMVLWFCGLTEATLATDLAEPGVPWEALCLHYHVVAKRAIEARTDGHRPNGATLRQRIETLRAQAGRKAR